MDVVNDLVLDFGEQVRLREGSLRDLRTGILAVKLVAGESPSGILEIPHDALALKWSSGCTRRRIGRGSGGRDQSRRAWGPRREGSILLN